MHSSLVFLPLPSPKRQILAMPPPACLTCETATEKLHFRSSQGWLICTAALRSRAQSPKPAQPCLGPTCHPGSRSSTGSYGCAQCTHCPTSSARNSQQRRAVLAGGMPPLLGSVSKAAVLWAAHAGPLPLTLGSLISSQTQHGEFLEVKGYFVLAVPNKAVCVPVHSSSLQK